MYAVIDVDDKMLTWSSYALLFKLIIKLHDMLSLKKSSIPQYFLGIEVHYKENGTLILTQTKYIWDLLAKINMNEAKGKTTPMIGAYKLSKHGDDKLSTPFLYISTVGELQYVTITHLDIAYFVNKYF